MDFNKYSMIMEKLNLTVLLKMVGDFMFTQCGGICPRLTCNIEIMNDCLGSNNYLCIIS